MSLTSSVNGKLSTLSRSKKSKFDFDCLILISYGGVKESRTPDLLRARQALYQLSYNPINGGSNKT